MSFNNDLFYVFNFQHIVYNIYTATIIMMPFYMENCRINGLKLNFQHQILFYS